MYLFQILVPVKLQSRNASRSKREITRIERELTKEYGGVTAFSQSPAEGLWRNSKTVTRDTIVIVEVMCKTKREQWWKQYRRELEHRLNQNTIVIRYYNVNNI
jgi:hypothetical protein